MIDIKQVAKRSINGALKPLGVKVVAHQPRNAPASSYRTIEPILCALAACLGRPVRIIQIGANDGVRGDPLVDFIGAGHSLQALLIEPHPYPFRLLKERYRADSRVTLANVAIGETGVTHLFSLAEDYRAEYWRAVGRQPDEISSSDPEHLVPRIAERLNVSPDEARKMIVEIDVCFASLPEVIMESGFPEQFDVLQVDVEGFDDRIIKGIDLHQHAVRVINYERFIIATSAYESLGRHLESFGFVRFPDGADECAVRPQFSYTQSRQ